ncbi:MAG: zinc ribbon domain-containing protein [Acidobacteriota bacterium]
MPIYEYQCQDCGHRLEAIQRISDAPLVTCPTCGNDSLKKLISAPAFQFKGSGWYVTDYADKNKKSGAGSSSDKSETKKDTKSDDSSSSDTSSSATASSSSESKTSSSSESSPSAS